MRFDGPESSAIVTQEFNSNRALVRAAKTRFHSLDHHVPHRFTRQSSADPGTPGDDLAVAAVLHENTSHDFAVVAGDLEAVRAPALQIA